MLEAFEFVRLLIINCEQYFDIGAPSVSAQDVHQSPHPVAG